MTTELRLQIGQLENGRSYIKDQYFTSPLKLGIPHTDGNRLDIVLMMASAGILKGDHFSYDICCDPGTKTMITEQSYAKIFDTGEGAASKEQVICLKKDASLYYRPCTVIPFGNSSYEGDLRVCMSKEGELAYSDILAAGRVGMGEKFAFRRYRNRVSVEHDGQPVWIDNCLLEPDLRQADDMLHFDRYTHLGTFYYCGTKQKEEKLLNFFYRSCHNADSRHTDDAPIMTAASHARAGICIRALAYMAQDIEKLFDKLVKALE